jgi:hypothetical protein
MVDKSGPDRRRSGEYSKSPETQVHCSHRCTVLLPLALPGGGRFSISCLSFRPEIHQVLFFMPFYELAQRSKKLGNELAGSQKIWLRGRNRRLLSCVPKRSVVDPHPFRADSDSDPAQNLNADPVQAFLYIKKFLWIYRHFFIFYCTGEITCLYLGKIREILKFL